MTTYKVGYFVGSLAATRSTARCPRRWSSWRRRTWSSSEIAIRNLPLYSHDYDADYPPVARALKEAIAGVDAVLFVTPGVQPLHPGRTQERHRLGEPPLGEELLRAQALRRDRRLDRAPSAPRWRSRACAAC